MKRLVVISAMAAFLVFTGCKSSSEKMGDQSWASAQISTGGEKIMAEKRAYIFYKEAMDAEGSEAIGQAKKIDHGDRNESGFLQ